MDKVVIPIVGFLITVTLAVWKYLYEVKQRTRAEKLSRIEAQLKQLYGPLYALVNARKKSWAIFESKTRVDEWDRLTQAIPEEDKEEWKRWMRSEFQETNERIYRLIVENADLYIENGLPVCFESFIAHYAQYRIIISRWDAGDDCILFAETRYPGLPLEVYAQEAFLKLKATQFKLLGHRHELSEPEARETKLPHGKRAYEFHGSE